MTGPATANADTSTGNQQTVLLLTALIIVAVISSLLVHRSPVLWLLPLAGAVAAIIVAQASAHGLANAGLTMSTLSLDIVIVLIFARPATTRCCRLHQYREELRHRAATEDAMAAA